MSVSRINLVNTCKTNFETLNPNACAQCKLCSYERISNNMTSNSVGLCFLKFLPTQHITKTFLFVSLIDEK